MAALIAIFTTMVFTDTLAALPLEQITVIIPAEVVFILTAIVVDLILFKLSNKKK